MNGTSIHTDPTDSVATPTRAILLISIGLLLVSVVLRLIDAAEVVGRALVSAVTITVRAALTAISATVDGAGRLIRGARRHRTAVACTVVTPVVGCLAVTAYAALG